MQTECGNPPLCKDGVSSCILKGQKKTTGTPTVATQRCRRTGTFVTAFGPHLHNDRCSTSAVPGPAYWTLVCKLPLNTCRRLRMILTPSHWPCYSPGINFSGRRASLRLKRSGFQGQAAVISIIPVTCQTECELMRECGFHLQSFINPVGTYRLPHYPAKWDTAFI